MAHSSLATVKVPATNYTEGRERPIRFITVHYMAGDLSVERCGEVLNSRGVSAHYGVGSDGRIGSYVEEENTAWANGNWNSNNECITIETANISNADGRVTDAAFNSLVKLIADIAKRNNLGTIEHGKNLNYHSEIVPTSCPGDYLRSKINEIAERANKVNGGETPKPTPVTPANYTEREVAEAVIRGVYGNGEDRRRNLENAGYNYNSIQNIVNEILGGGGAPAASSPDLSSIADQVIAGEWGNGEDRRTRLVNAGYNYDEVQRLVNEKLGYGGSAPKVATGAIQVGDRVVLNVYEDYNGIGLAKTREFYYVSELNGDRAVLAADSQNGPVYAAVRVNNLREV